MSIQTDVVVIGSGAAGAVAMARAKQRGLEVLGVTKSLGATAYSPGAIDQSSGAQAALDLFCELTEEIQYVRSEFAITEHGLVVPCSMVQISQYVDLARFTQEDPIAVVEFSGLPGFSALSVAKMLGSHGYQAVPIRAAFDPKSKQRWNTFLEFAKNFEDPEFVDDCMDAIVDAVQRANLDLKHLFLPAVFGVRESPLIFLRSIQMRCGVSCSELLGASHSLPGLRLGHVLQAGFENKTVTGFKKEGDRLTQLVLNTGEIVEPRSAILATGRYLSGGFNEQEIIFGLPLSQDDKFRRGLNCDGTQRPLGKFGELFASNLFAAGSSIGGYDPIFNGGLSRAIETGYRAGDLC